MTKTLASAQGGISARARAIVTLLLFLCASLAGSVADAQLRITVETGKSIVLPDATDDIGTVFVADPSIADASLSPNNTVFVFGKQVGETSLVVEALGGEKTRTFTVVVTHNLSELTRSLSNRFPDASIGVESSRGSILVRGVVGSEQMRADVIATLRASVPQSAIIDRLSVRTSNHIGLRVRLIEVQQREAGAYGIDWNATVAGNGFALGVDNGGILRLSDDDDAEDSLNASVDLLVNRGVATILQETSLSTVNGGEAVFAVGEEIPVPAVISDSDGADDGNFSLDYKFIGTRLVFRPSSAPGNKLRLDIDSVISNETQTSGTVNGNVFPNLNTRSFQSSVELVDGQSFVIAGLSRRETDASIRGSRGGAFSNLMNRVFGRDLARDSGRDLIVIVTPDLGLGQSISVDHVLPRHATNLEFILSRTGASKGLGGPVQIDGPAGFKY